MDRVEPLKPTVNAVFELTTVNTVKLMRKYMIPLGGCVNGYR
jgi:hypothetical protein